MISTDEYAVSAAMLAKQDELRRQLEQEKQNALAILYGTGRYEEDYGAMMSAALAHSNIALLFRRELEEILNG